MWANEVAPDFGRYLMFGLPTELMNQLRKASLGLTETSIPGEGHDAN
jgi:hypothetical protein